MIKGATPGLVCLIGSLLLAGCSPDILPVHYSRVNSAKTAGLELKLEPGAPGAFVQSWEFSSHGGYRHDPAEIRIAEGVARLLPGVGPAGSPRWAALETSYGRQFNALFQFKEIPGPGNEGKFRYQVTNDQASWYFHDGTRWQKAERRFESANTADQLQAALPRFHREIGNGQVFIRIFLVSPHGREVVELKKIELGGLSPKTDGWN